MENKNTGMKAAGVGSASMSSTVLGGKKQHNKLLPVVVVLAILAVAGCGFGVWGVVSSASRGDEVAKLEAKIQDRNAEIAELKGVSVEEIETSESEGLEEVAVKSYSLPNLSLYGAKVLDSSIGDRLPDYWQQHAGSTMMPGLDLYLQHDARLGQNSIRVMINVEKFAGSYYDVTMPVSSGTVEWNIAEIDVNRVVSVDVGLIGQDAAGATLLYLMDDGTVEYTPLHYALKNNQFKSFGTLGQVSDVIKFYHIDFDGFHTYAQRASGELVDLTSLVYETGYYK